MKLVVKNTFLEFELNENKCGSDNCRRRASSFPANCARDAIDDYSDNLDTEVGSTDGSSTPSWTSELQYPGDISPSRNYELDLKDLCVPRYSDWSMMDDGEQSYGPTFADSPWHGCLHSFEHPQCAAPETQISEFSLAKYNPEMLARLTHADSVATEVAPRNGYGDLQHGEWPSQSLLASAPAHDFPVSPSKWNHSTSAQPKYPSRRAPIESPRRSGAHHSPQRSPNWNNPATYNMVQPRSPVATKPESKYTTIMLRNLPNDYTRDMLVDLLESQGFGGSFNFVYLPFDFRKNAGLGYAFVNMSTNRDAKRAMKDLTGFREWKLKSQKVLQITWSTPLQGLWANVERYRNSPVMHPEVPEKFKPLLLADGLPIEFPLPTKSLQAPNSSSSMWY